MTEPRNESDKWILQAGCHRGTLTSRDTDIPSEHDSEADARREWDDIQRGWRSIGLQVWFARLVPPGAAYRDSITLHAGEPYR